MAHMDIIVMWVLNLVVFAALSVLFGPDSRDTRRPMDQYGSWAGLQA